MGKNLKAINQRQKKPLLEKLKAECKSIKISITDLLQKNFKIWTIEAINYLANQTLILMKIKLYYYLLYNIRFLSIGLVIT